MNTDTIQNTIAIISLILALIASIDAWKQRSNKKEIKQYAAEREFGHIKNTLQTYSEHAASMDRDIQELRLEISEVKSLLTMLVAIKRSEYDENR